MQQNLKSTPSLEQAAQAAQAGNRSTVRSAPIELDMSQLKHVSGGSPKGTWDSYSAVVESPKGTW